MQHDDELNQMLAGRAAPPKAKADLAERIIHAAVSQVQEKPRAAQGFWNDVMSMLVIPHPSVAVATGIILGLMIGLQMGDGLVVLQQDWASFLDINEGGWL